jgi:hypothetical protein
MTHGDPEAIIRPAVEEHRSHLFEIEVDVRVQDLRDGHRDRLSGFGSTSRTILTRDFWCRPQERA